MSDIKWYYAAGQEQRGPLNDADMAVFISEGTVHPQTMVWHQGMTDWQPAQAVLPSSLIPPSWAGQTTLAPPPIASSAAGGAVNQAGQAGRALGQRVSQTIGQSLGRVGIDFSTGDNGSGEYHHPTEYLYVIKTVLNRYVQFSGRARRMEFWLWTVSVWVVLVVGFGLAAATGVVLGEIVAGLLSMLVSLLALAIMLPSLAVSVRRLHDTGRSAWWLLIMIIPFGSLVLLVLYMLPSKPENNQFGPA